MNSLRIKNMKNSNLTTFPERKVTNLSDFAIQEAEKTGDKLIEEIYPSLQNQFRRATSVKEDFPIIGTSLQIFTIFSAIAKSDLPN
jgi:hypothetical protein